MASLSSVKFKRLHLHFPFRLSFCLSLLCLYLFLNRLNLSAPARKLPYTTTGTGTTSIKKVNITNSYSAILYTGNQVEANLEKGKYPFVRALKTVENKSDSCGGRYIYVHDLPPKFNEDILKECDLFIGPKMCPYLENNGLGHKLENAQGVFSDNGWYDTDQFTLEPMFYHRMKQYDCLTHDSSLAAAIFVPFYAGCDISRHFFGYSNKIRDELSYELANWLRNTPEWRIMGGKDHFLVAGRVTWEFRRLTNNESDWGDQLFLIPETKNMTALVIESSPWHSNDFAIPYPTFFHPSNDVQLNHWQERVRNLKREWLFSFAGAPRPKDPKSIRSEILDQCKNSKVCKMLECSIGNDKSCHSPEKVMQLFQKSHFCLQPQGDSPTRKSTFDAIIAGCIPVFFHPGSAYIQYTWHLPKNYSTYSVFITEDEIRKNNASIEETLRKISPEVIVEMRGKVIELIPKIIYADSGSKSRTFKDAFDISVEAVIRRVTRLRMDIVNGRKHENFHEELSWKYALFEDDEDQPELLGAHEWDPYFRF